MAVKWIPKLVGDRALCLSGKRVHLENEEADAALTSDELVDEHETHFHVHSIFFIFAYAPFTS